MSGSTYSSTYAPTHARHARRWLVLFLAFVVCACATLLPVRSAFAITSSDGLWEYTLNDDGDAIITAYLKKGTISELQIDDIDGHDVAEIKTQVFHGDTRLTQVFFPATVTKLGDALFAECTNLEVAGLAAMEELPYIPPECFTGCKSLKQVTIPASVTEIAPNAFYECEGLETLNFGAPSSLTKIDGAAFSGCKSLTSVEFPRSLQTIGVQSFENCEALSSVTFLGSSPGTVAFQAFAGCTALTEICLPDALTNLGKEAFKDCSGLKTVMFTKLPALNDLGEGIFSGCPNIKCCVVPDGVSVGQELRLDVPDAAYWIHVQSNDANALTVTVIAMGSTDADVTIPVTVGKKDITAIAAQAGYKNGCQKMRSVVFPAGSKVTSIGAKAFYECTGLRFATLPAGLETLGEQAFMKCEMLHSVTFALSSETHQTSLSTIPTEAFRECYALEKINIPEGVQIVGERAFYGCYEADSLYLPDTLTTVGDDAFNWPTGADGMSIQTVRMPDSDREVRMPYPDGKFYGTWANKATLKFQVTYGSWADFEWFQPRLDNGNFTENNRTYIPVDIDTGKGVTMVDPDDVTFDGTRQMPVVTGTRWKGTIHEHYPMSTMSDFSLSPADGYDCKSVGEQKVVVTGQSPHFKGSTTLTYTINEADIYTATMSEAGPFTWDNDYYTFDDCDTPPTFSIELGGTTYQLGDDDIDTIEISDNKEPGQATVTLTAKGNFTGSKDFHFTILPSPLEEAQVSVGDQRYNGGKVEPMPDEAMLKNRSGVYDPNLSLIPNSDYTLSYDNNEAVGQAQMTLTAASKYVSGSITVPFNIVQADLADAVIQPVPNQTYTGSAIKPDLVVKVGSGQLTLGTDYTVEWENNVNVSTDSACAKATLTGVGPGCKGTNSVEFTIAPKQVTVTPKNISKVYGTADPEFEVTVSGTVGSDTVAYELARDAGEAVGGYAIKASGEAAQGNYAVSFGEGTLTIEAADISDNERFSVDAIADIPYDGTAKTPKPVVRDAVRGVVLEDGDYTLSYGDNVEPGSVTVTISGAGNYKGSCEASFNIVAADLADATIVAVPEQTYSGTFITPDLVVKVGNGQLVQGTDFTVEWENNVNVSTGSARAVGTLTGLAPHCKGTNTVRFTIVPKSMMVTPNNVTKKYGEPDPEFTAHVSGAVDDFQPTYKFTRDAGEKVGDYTIKASGEIEQGNYVVAFGIGTLTIETADIGDDTRFSVDPIKDAYYDDGAPREPVPVVRDAVRGTKLAAGTDFTLSYDSNTEIGTATVTITGTGNYEGSRTTSFNIVEYVPEYVLVEGPTGPIKQGQGAAAQFRFERTWKDETTFGHYVSAAVDGKKLKASECTVKKGSVIITLKSKFIDSLKPGKHTLSVFFDDGAVSTAFALEKPDPEPSPDPDPNNGGDLPNSGDTLVTTVLPFVILALLVGCGFCLAGRLNAGRKRRL